MHGYVEDVFESVAKLDAVAGVRRGEIYEDKPLYLPARHSVRISDVNPNGYRAEFEVVGGRSDSLFRHSPLKTGINLPDGEAMAIAKSKNRRPVVVLSLAVGSELAVGSGAARPVKTALCAPLYGGDQFPKELIDRVRKYEFPNLFYVPRSTSPPVDEGFIRFDHIQAIQIEHLKARRARFTDEAMEFMDEWLSNYLLGRLPETSIVEMYCEEVESL